MNSSHKKTPVRVLNMYYDIVNALTQFCKLASPVEARVALADVVIAVEVYKGAGQTRIVYASLSSAMVQHGRLDATQMLHIYEVYDRGAHQEDQHTGIVLVLARGRFVASWRQRACPFCEAESGPLKVFDNTGFAEHLLRNPVQLEDDDDEFVSKCPTSIVIKKLVCKHLRGEKVEMRL